MTHKESRFLGSALNVLRLFRLLIWLLAIALYDQALEIKPDYPGAWYNRENVMENLSNNGYGRKAYVPRDFWLICLEEAIANC